MARAGTLVGMRRAGAPSAVRYDVAMNRIDTVITSKRQASSRTALEPLARTAVAAG